MPGSDASELGGFAADVAAEIRAQRARLDLSQDELADRTNLSTSTIQRIERGQHSLGADVLRTVAVALGLTPSELVRRAEHYGTAVSVRLTSPQSVGGIDVDAAGDVKLEVRDVDIDQH